MELPRYRIVSSSDPQEFEKLINEYNENGYFLFQLIPWQYSGVAWGVMVGIDDENDDEDEGPSYSIKLTPN